MINLLLEDPQFAVLSNHVADFFDETMAAGYAARNQLYASISEVVGRIGKEDAKLRGAAKKTSKIVSGMTTPLYETELTQMQAEFRSIIVRLKKEFPSRVEEMKKLTREAFQNTVEHFTKGGEASQLMQVSEEEFAERFKQSLAYLPEISDRISDELLSAFISIARIAAQKKE